MSAVASAGRSRQAGQSIHVRCETRDGARDCRVLELQSEGAFIESFVPLPTGAKVNLLLHLPGGDVSAAGIVTNHQFSVGFGVAFTQLSTGDRRAIASFSGR